MLALWNKVAEWLQDEDRGATMVEYALMVALIAVISIAVITIVGQETSSAFDSVGTAMN